MTTWSSSSAALEAVFQKTVPGQSPDQQVNLLVDGPGAGGERGKRQTHAQILRATAAPALNVPKPTE